MTITKTRLVYLLSVALPGFASVWLTAGFSAAPSPTGTLLAVLGAAATGVLVNTWLAARPGASASAGGGLLHQTDMGPTAAAVPAPAVVRRPFRRGR